MKTWNLILALWAIIGISLINAQDFVSPFSTIDYASASEGANIIYATQPDGDFHP